MQPNLNVGQTSMSRYRRIMIILGAGLLILALVMVFGSTAPLRKITPLGIRLVGFASGPSQSRVSECIVSNSNDRAIWVWPAKPQVRSNGEWPLDLVRLPVRYTGLKPHQTAQFTVIRPTNANAEACRVPLFWVLQPRKKEWVDEVIRQNVIALQSRTALPGTRISWGSKESWTNYSPEIAP